MAKGTHGCRQSLSTVYLSRTSHLTLPEAHTTHTELLDLKPLPVTLTALGNGTYEALYKFTHFNPIQTQAFHVLYHTYRNVLLGAPTGSGKKISAELAMLHLVRVRGGNVKWRALRLDTGNYSWGSEAVTQMTHILDVVYNASNNELVRTQTLVKSVIVQVDVSPFKQWYLQHYEVDIDLKKAAAKKEEEAEAAATEDVKKGNHVQRKLEKRQNGRKINPHIEEQFDGGCLLAAISSRPGQCGRADGYILKGKELEFYMKKIEKKKGRGAGGN